MNCDSTYRVILGKLTSFQSMCNEDYWKDEK
jgi:hypothetical protein